MKYVGILTWRHGTELLPPKTKRKDLPNFNLQNQAHTDKLVDQSLIVPYQQLSPERAEKLVPDSSVEYWEGGERKERKMTDSLFLQTPGPWRPQL